MSAPAIDRIKKAHEAVNKADEALTEARDIAEEASRKWGIAEHYCINAVADYEKVLIENQPSGM